MIPDSEKIEYKGQAMQGYSGSISFKCYFCNEKVSGVVPRYYPMNPSEYSVPKSQKICWLLCPSCSHGSVLDRDGNVYPTAIKGEIVKGLQGVVKDVYEEATKCFSFNAFTACELLCRKLLMHVAVDKGAEESKSFEYYITYLQDGDYITPPMKTWVDLIRTHGNKSTHTIEPVEEGRAKSTLTFTAMLLKLIYETEYFASEFIPEEENNS